VSGFARFASAAPALDAPAADRPLLRRVAALFQPHRGRLLLISLAIVVSSGLGIVNPFLTQRERVVRTQQYSLGPHNFHKKLKRSLLEYSGIHAKPVQVVARRKL